MYYNDGERWKTQPAMLELLRIGGLKKDDDIAPRSSNVNYAVSFRIQFSFAFPTLSSDLIGILKHKPYAHRNISALHIQNKTAGEHSMQHSRKPLTKETLQETCKSTNQPTTQDS